jgi:hypothetical protein
MAEAGRDLHSPARRGYPLGLRALWRQASKRIAVFGTTLGRAKLTISNSWLVYKVVDIIIYRSTQHPAIIATGIITNVAVIISVLSAFPWVRKLVSRSPMGSTGCG